VRVGSTVAGAGAAALLAASPAATAPTSGLYGVVRKGPIAPVCRQGVACDAPAEVTLVFSRLGRDVGRTRSTASGRYRIALPPGFYAVRTLERIGITPNIRPRNVHVRVAHFDRLDFSIDTGIR
jgi:hypothetical protein